MAYHARPRAPWAEDYYSEKSPQQKGFSKGYTWHGRAPYGEESLTNRDEAYQQSKRGISYIDHVERQLAREANARKYSPNKGSTGGAPFALDDDEEAPTKGNHNRGGGGGITTGSSTSVNKQSRYHRYETSQAMAETHLSRRDTKEAYASAIVEEAKAMGYHSRDDLAFAITRAATGGGRPSTAPSREARGELSLDLRKLRLSDGGRGRRGILRSGRVEEEERIEVDENGHHRRYRRHRHHRSRSRGHDTDSDDDKKKKAAKKKEGGGGGGKDKDKDKKKDDKDKDKKKDKENEKKNKKEVKKSDWFATVSRKAAKPKNARHGLYRVTDKTKQINFKLKYVLPASTTATTRSSDALRDLTGTFFADNNSIAVYESRSLATRTSLLPFIARGCYNYIDAESGDEFFPYSPHDLEVGSVLVFRAAGQPNLPASLATKTGGFIHLEVTFIDERERALLADMARHVLTDEERREREKEERAEIKKKKEKEKEKKEKEKEKKEKEERRKEREAERRSRSRSRGGIRHHRDCSCSGCEADGTSSSDSSSSGSDDDGHYHRRQRRTFAAHGAIGAAGPSRSRDARTTVAVARARSRSRSRSRSRAAADRRRESPGRGGRKRDARDGGESYPPKTSYQAASAWAVRRRGGRGRDDDPPSSSRNRLYDDKRHKRTVTTGLTPIRDAVCDALAAHGPAAVLHLHRELKRLDRNDSGVLPRDDIARTLRKFGVDLDDEFLDLMWEAMQHGSYNGRVSYADVVRLLIGQMSEARLALVKAAFRRQCEACSNFAHCDLSTRQFLTQMRWTRGCPYADFELYYEGVSLAFETDKDFYAQLRRLWGNLAGYKA